MPEVQGRILDRRIPTDFSHVEKYPARLLLARTVERVERILSIHPRYHAIYDQGAEGACVGFGQSIMMSMLNRRLYDARWLYLEAQLVDEYADTPPGEGTSLRAGFDILRTKGHRRLYAGASKPPNIDEGIVEVNRWLTTVDEVRTSISEGKQVNIGINWYRSFYETTGRPSGSRNRIEQWLGVGGTNWGNIAGGHDITIGAASDRRQAVGVYNSWGESYAWPAWLPYDSLTRLLGEQGEAAIVTDR
jgi:hypothetical protein